jgi:hypothetical protein
MPAAPRAAPRSEVRRCRGRQRLPTILGGRAINDAPSLFGDTRIHSARWQLRLLGDVPLGDGRGAQLRLPDRAATALLAQLALAPIQAHGREALIELLLPGVALGAGRNRLRQLLSTLKCLLDTPGAGGAVPLADRQAVRLGERALACDATDFETALRAGRLDEARALYRGELLPGFYDDWIHDERLRLAALADAAGARRRADVQAQRLVTLLGPGGQGKTRLAMEVAHSLEAPQRWDALRPGGLAPARFDLAAFVPPVAWRAARPCPDRCCQRCCWRCARTSPARRRWTTCSACSPAAARCCC